MRRAPQHQAGIVSLTVGKTDPKVLQDFLSGGFRLSRRAAKAVVDGRSVWVNRRCVWIARYALHTGDLVELPSRTVKGAEAQSAGRRVVEKGGSAPRIRHVRVLWRNGSYLVCDKPAGMVSCDDPKSAEAALRSQENEPALEAVHRLDRDTTGCLLFAKNRAAYAAAVEIFKTHRVSKIYHAIVAGRFGFAHQTIETPVDGRPAVSKVTREAAGPEASLLRVRIETGRTNQIRRHLASVRHPVVGDRVFGLKSVRDARLMKVPRQMLHASELTLPDPLDPRCEIKVHSPLPADFRAALRLFGMGRRSSSPR
ncbi:MAG: RluA family pseudouridine synthase [Kiritimatiellae bacterium]|nr:RluA family pseudouridine synthase [Kiritimatiellia bacterium]